MKPQSPLSRGNTIAVASPWRPRQNNRQGDRGNTNDVERTAVIAIKTTAVIAIKTTAVIAIETEPIHRGDRHRDRSHSTAVIAIETAAAPPR